MSFSPAPSAPYTEDFYSAASSTPEATSTHSQAPHPITWIDFISEAQLMEPIYQKFTLRPPPPGSASFMPIQKLHFANITHGVKRVCRIEMEDLKSCMAEYFERLGRREDREETPKYLSASELASLNSHVQKDVLSVSGSPDETEASDRTRMLVATDDPSFTGNVHRHVLDLIMELGVHVKGDRLKEKQFYVDAYQKMAPISCAVLQSASNPDSEMRKNNATMAVFVIPPWYMGELELEAFVKCSKVEKFESLWPNVALSGDKPVQSRDVPVNENNLPHALWILISERCIADYIDYFVLTTYEHWVFGFIGKGNKRTGYVTSPLARNIEMPNILGMLMLWTLSSVSGTSGWTPPELSRNSQHRQDSTESSTTSGSESAIGPYMRSHTTPFSSLRTNQVNPSWFSFVEDWQADSMQFVNTPSSTSGTGLTSVMHSPVVASTPSVVSPALSHYTVLPSTTGESGTDSMIGSPYSGASLYSENGGPLFDITHYARYAHTPSEAVTSDAASFASRSRWPLTSDTNNNIVRHYATPSQAFPNYHRPAPTPNPSFTSHPIPPVPVAEPRTAFSIPHSHSSSYDQQTFAQYYWEQDEDYAQMTPYGYASDSHGMTPQYFPQSMR